MKKNAKIKITLSVLLMGFLLSFSVTLHAQGNFLPRPPIFDRLLTQGTRELFAPNWGSQAPKEMFRFFLDGSTALGRLSINKVADFTPITVKDALMQNTSHSLNTNVDPFLLNSPMKKKRRTELMARAISKIAGNAKELVFEGLRAEGHRGAMSNYLTLLNASVDLYHWKIGKLLAEEEPDISSAILLLESLFTSLDTVTRIFGYQDDHGYPSIPQNLNKLLLSDTYYRRLINETIVKICFDDLYTSSHSTDATIKEIASKGLRFFSALDKLLERTLSTITEFEIVDYDTVSLVEVLLRYQSLKANFGIHDNHIKDLIVSGNMNALVEHFSSTQQKKATIKKLTPDDFTSKY